MLRIVIFGTGSSGTRALYAARNRSDIDVVGFSDNDKSKHGTEHEGLPVIPPTKLDGIECDFIVLASQFAQDIRRGLLEGGLNDGRLVIPNLNDFAGCMRELAVRAIERNSIVLDGGRQIAAGELPRVLILTYETLNQSHGTGVLVQRYFKDFPANRLFSICHQDTGQPWLKNSLSLSAELTVSQNAKLIHQAFIEQDFLPDLVYATVFDEIDLNALAAVLDVLPDGIPVIQHFMDYMPHDSNAFDQRFVALSDRIAEIWALTEGMSRELRRRYGLDVQHMTALHQDVPAATKQDYADFSSGFRTVVLGNLWQPWMMPMLDRIWCNCMRARPGLRPIEWYVHPLRAQAMIDAGYALGNGIQWRGFVTGHALQAQLTSAELAILPFNAEATANDDYARFSLPSRLTELCGAGLPIVVIASPDTEPAQFISERDCGLVVAGPYEDTITRQLLHAIDDRALRQRIGSAARMIADTTFALGPFQMRLLGKLFDRAAAYRPPADWPGLLQSGLVPLDDNINSAPLQESLPPRVHYACGRNIFPGWLNVDGFDESYPHGEALQDLAKQIFRLDLTGPHPFPDNHFEAGYSEDFIEHINQDEFVIFLCEAFRTFKPGGVLRMSTPDLDGILERHLRGTGWQAGNAFREEAYKRWWHKHYLCRQEIEAIAAAIGWQEVRVCEYGQSTVGGLALETRPNQADLNLIVELVK